MKKLFKSFWDKPFTVKLAVFLCAALILSLIPLYAISIYTHPSGDDYTYGNYTVNIYDETNSFFSAIGNALGAAVERWQNWQGTHSAIFLMALMPSVFGYDLYPLGAILLITAFVLCGYFLSHVITRKYLALSKEWALILSIPFVIISMQFAPSIVEGFFWYNGAWYYTFYFCLAILWIGLLLLYIKNGKKLLLVPIFFLSFFIGGGNYPLVLMLSLVGAGIAVYGFYIKSNKKYLLLTSELVLVLSFLLSAIAPGNSVRAAMNTPMSAPKAVILALYNALKSVYSHFHGLELVIYIALIPLFFMVAEHIVKACRYKFKYPFAVIGFAFGIYASMYVPTLYAMSNTGPGRIQDIYHYTCVILIMFSLLYLCGWLYAKFKVKMTVKENFLILLVAAVVLTTTCGYSDINSLNSVQAVRQIADGSASGYDKEMDARQVVLNDESVKYVVLEPLKNKPSVIFLWDIKADAQIWRNKDMASYYNKNSVVLSYDDGGY